MPTEDISRIVPFRDGNLAMAFRPTSDGYYAPVFLEGDPVVKKYNVAIQAAEDSLLEVAIVEATIPANDWQEHQSMILDLWLSWKVDAGYGGAGVPIKLKWGATSVTIDTISDIDTTIQTQRYKLELRRIGSDIYVQNNEQTNGNLSINAPKAIDAVVGVAQPWTTGVGNSIQTAQSFTTEKTLQLTAQWDEANANNIVECISATLIKL